MSKTINVKVEFEKIGRGEAGREFFTSTFRFPLKVAQGMEVRAMGMGLSMSTILNQLAKGFVDSTPAPKGIVPVKTKTARVTAGPAKSAAPEKPKAPKKEPKAKKLSVEEINALRQERKKKPAAASVLEKLQKRKKAA